MAKKKTITTSIVVPVHHFLVVLKMPTTNDAYLTKAKGIYKAVINVTNFPTFPTGTPGFTAAIFNTDILAFDNAESNLKLKPPLSTAKQRDGFKTIVANDLESVRLGVQALVNANPKNAKTIAQNAGMDVKLIATHGATGGTAKKGTAPNSWNVDGEGAGMHDWRISSDGEKTWSPLPPTRGKKTVVSGLTRGVDYKVQSRQVLTKGQYSAWSASIDLPN